MNRRTSYLRARSAMTLLELILALFIASLVMMAIAMAIQLQAMTVDSRRNVVEEVQLARAILKQISDDLRSAARYEELTISDASSEAIATGDDANAADSALSDLDLQNSANVTSIPGIFGTQYQLQVDVSRVPRIDEFQPLMPESAGQMIDVPSGYRTIAYYVGVQTDPTTGEQVTGLIRRELDRTITDFAVRMGNIANIESQGELLAAEVTAIEFRYFDGVQYLYEWDTSLTTALPLAVEINLWLRSPVSGRDVGARDQTSTLYRMVVAIPTGEYPPDASAMGTDPSAGGASDGTLGDAGGS
jgi:type II secretory pathway pseudopilin PulG